MPKAKNAEGLVHVATAPNPVIAASWQEMLRSEGIPSVVKTTDPLAAAYSVSSFYACDILVPESYAERARDLLGGLARCDAVDEKEGGEE